MIYTTAEETIIARCTPQGPGAIALIRLSGESAIPIADSLAELSSGKSLKIQSTHSIHHGYVVHPTTRQRIDEVLFLLMKGPKTFTGQDTFEITCHNNPHIINTIISSALQQGARIAQPGEFTKRAVLSGKLDIVQAEALNEVIHANTRLAVQYSLAQLSGTLSAHLQNIEQELIQLLGFVEASFEFLDEEQRDLDFDIDVIHRLKKLHHTIAQLSSDLMRQNYLRDGARIALLGGVNAGKSTLFNTLLGKQRAIVSPQPGTTRDSIEAHIHYDNNNWLLIDTAGIRITNDVIEHHGIQRSWQEAETADLILIIIDVSQPLCDELIPIYKELFTRFACKCLIIANKVDATREETKQTLTKQEIYPDLWISSQHNVGIQELISTLQKKISDLFEQEQSPFLLTQRQHLLLQKLDRDLSIIINRFFDNKEYELLACSLKEIVELFAELTGKTLNEKVMDSVFSSFCVGK